MQWSSMCPELCYLWGVSEQCWQKAEKKEGCARVAHYVMKKSPLQGWG